MPIKSDRLGPGRLTLGEIATEKEFGAQMTACAIEPDTEQEDAIPVLSGEELAGDETYTFELTGTLLQSYDIDGLQEWAHTNKGIEMPFIFVPNNTAARGVSGIVKIRPMKYGGDVKTRNTSDFTFAGVGDYSFIDPAAI